MARRGYAQDGDRDEDQAGQRPCARGDFCARRTVTFEDGERIITPAMSPRAYCDRCSGHIARCAADLPGFWLRLAAKIGDPLQAEVQVHIPFGPQVILREDVDAHLRFTALTVAGWAGRVRGIGRIAPPVRAHDCAGGVRDNALLLERHVTVLLALGPGWMTRQIPVPPMPRDEDMRVLGTDWLPQPGQVAPAREPAEPLPPDLAQEYADHELVRVTIDSMQPMVLADGEDAGRDIQWLHYRSRSLLLETNPPPEVLITPCRQCTRRALRRAWPDSERDLYSRCDYCQDEMSSEEYDVNAKRWVAYHQHQEMPVLEATPAA
jgi:hypothetical protein